MTIELDGLERSTRLWKSRAETVGHVTPDDVLALIERTRALDAALHEIAKGMAGDDAAACASAALEQSE